MVAQLLAGQSQARAFDHSIGAGVLPFAEKLAHCRDFYQRHGLPCLFRITPFSQPHGLDADLRPPNSKRIRTRG